MGEDGYLIYLVLRSLAVLLYGRGRVFDIFSITFFGSAVVWVRTGTREFRLLMVRRLPLYGYYYY